MESKTKNVESKIAVGQLILRKIIKTVATRCQILRLKCTKIQNSAYRAPPDPLLGCKGLLLSGGEWRERDGRGGDGRGGEEREGKGVSWSPKILKIDPVRGSTKLQPLHQYHKIRSFPPTVCVNSADKSVKTCFMLAEKITGNWLRLASLNAFRRLFGYKDKIVSFLFDRS